MSVDYLPPDDPHAGDDDLDELLDLAAELSPAEELPTAWDRRARFPGDAAQARLLHGDSTGGEEEAIEEDAAESGPESAELVRTHLDAAVSELGDLALVEEPHRRHLPAIAYPRAFIPIPWRKP
ncbi:MAG: hypothetical protein QOG45_1785, partial [Chloroflexota bacterium]|nr:hypothetical protein [Chloroflexota bacterium]